MPIELIKDYSEFKKLVFARYGINAEHLRQKFRTLTKKPEESYSRLGTNLVRYFEKWLEQANVESLEDMKNIIGLEQFYLVLPGELRYLERKSPRMYRRQVKLLTI